MAVQWFLLCFSAATSLLVPVFDYNVSALLAPGYEDYLVMYTDARRTDLEELTEAFKSPVDNPKTQKLKYVILDCGVNATVCESHNVTDIPEFKYLYNGESHDYEWEWTPDGFFSIGHKISNPASYSLQRRVVFDNFKTRYDFSFMAWYFPLIPDVEHIARGEMLEKVAKDYRHRPIYFAQAAETTLRESEGIKFGEMPIVKQYGLDEVFGFKITEYNETTLRQFVEDHKWGLMTPLNRSLWKVLHKECQMRNKILLLVFHEGSNYQQFGDYLNNLRLLHWDMRRNKDYRFQMASVDIEKYPELAKVYNVTRAPQVVVVDWRRNQTEVVIADFDPTSKLHTIHYLREIYNFRTPTPIGPKPAAIPPAPSKSNVVWRQCLLVSGMLFVWWAIRHAANKKLKTA